MKKIIMSTSICLSLVILFSAVQYIRYYKIPDKRPVKMQFEDVEGITPLDESTKQIYVYNEADRGTIILGSDGKMYNVNSMNDYEKIYIIGNLPETFDESLSQNTFILNGEYIGKKKVNGEKGEGKKTFKVESFDILKRIRRDGTKNNKSTEYLTKSDYSGAFAIKMDEKRFQDLQ